MENTRYKKPEAVKKLEKLAQKVNVEHHPNFPYPPKIKYRDDTANGLTKCIVDFLNLKEHQAERINNTGRIKDNRKNSIDVLGRVRTVGSIKWIKGTGNNGTADISATIKGYSVKIEVKIGKDRQSEAQQAYEAQIKKAGGFYFIARNFTDFINWYNLKFEVNE
ncbi:hypothetical protein BWZ22_09750 [Seonamhaeicola sp. S2-3]|uniref:hypothetical protein n=1 Tax=Seonamhaeicola sp. S2-3 TaxID=1936081 RepID=UPI000972BB02|nr:hypothetical protein [Seonamhaeicola sp. S2-3]APY11510.1 hypothetical protein BWZ22_09750 [Seonamhaeicola sp. S2-3]